MTKVQAKHGRGTACHVSGHLVISILPITTGYRGLRVFYCCLLGQAKRGGYLVISIIPIACGYRGRVGFTIAGWVKAKCGWGTACYYSGWRSS